MSSLKDYIFTLKEILVSSPDKIIILNPEGKAVFVNDNFLTYTGYERKDKTRLSLTNLVGAQTKKTIELSLRNEKVCIKTAAFRMQNAVKKNNSFIVFNIWSEKNILGKVLILLDNNKKQEQLKNNLFEESILRTMNNRREAVWFITNIQNGKNAFISDSVKEILGWDVTHFNLGGWLFFFSIVHPKDATHLFSRYQEWVMMKNKLGILYDHVEYNSSFRIRNFDGEYIPIDTDSNVLERDEEGKIKMILGSFRPVDQKTMEDKKVQLNSSFIKVIEGRTYVELDYLRKIREEKEGNPARRSFSNLSARELEIFELIIEELSSNEISKKLNISIHTINLHRKQIMKKLEAKNLTGLIKIYYENR